MRHRKLSQRFSRKSSHRQAMFRNLAISLFQHELIKTTLPKAKALRGFVECLITLAKEDTVAKRRLVSSRLGNNKLIVKKLFDELGPRYGERPGGYTRVLKCGFRTGDNAPMAFIELVDRPEIGEAAEEE